MGISGLLPLLKPIQAHKHLSEFSGQTIAVDAYVWLHKGAYGCAPELATGKRTTKYVEYAMHRVRLLRHYHIEPYVVFDGGPLPAKKGTEIERKRKRDENLERGNALAAKGQHSQAREYYVKCVDVTPQMAFQLIKALRAESVPYVVAPYEADAQLAYLERLGIVDAILTEDSDLLVFGCRNVLFKLDVPTATLMSITRTEFASASPSFLGWSDTEFRAMAILSGCDYLPSIPGVGLKTAHKLLKKHKTVDKVVRAIRLEGKKDLPRDYLVQFKRAEKVFLHQRVYDPVFEKLVHLTDVPDGEQLDEETQAYVGNDIEPSLSKKIAEGDACPISLVQMQDINPSYVPRGTLVKSFTFPLSPKAENRLASISENSKGKGKSTLLQFFAPKPRSPTKQGLKSTSLPIPDKAKGATTMIVGRASGKRTLADVMDDDIAAKRIRREDEEARRAEATTNSRFFGGFAVAGPSYLHRNAEEEKENRPIFDEEGDADTEMEDLEDPVTQEDGYISPSPSCARLDTPDLSSPLRPSENRRRAGSEGDADFYADAISSPITVRKRRSRSRTLSQPPSPSPGQDRDAGIMLVRDTPTPTSDPGVDEGHYPGPDLRLFFRDQSSSEIGNFDGEGECQDKAIVDEDTFRERVNEEVGGLSIAEEEVSEFEDSVEAAQVARQDIVANGWWNKYARSATCRGSPRKSKRSPLRRRDAINSATIQATPKAKHDHRSSSFPSARSSLPRHPKGSKSSDSRKENQRTKPLARIVFEQAEHTPVQDSSDTRVTNVVQEVVTRAKDRLEAFKWARRGE